MTLSEYQIRKNKIEEMTRRPDYALVYTIIRDGKRFQRIYLKQENFGLVSPEQVKIFVAKIKALKKDTEQYFITKCLYMPEYRSKDMPKEGYCEVGDFIEFAKNGNGAYFYPFDPGADAWRRSPFWRIDMDAQVNDELDEFEGWI